MYIQKQNSQDRNYYHSVMLKLKCEETLGRSSVIHVGNIANSIVYWTNIYYSTFDDHHHGAYTNNPRQDVCFHLAKTFQVKVPGIAFEFKQI